MALAEQLGKRIVALRKERGITQEQLAYECGGFRCGIREEAAPPVILEDFARRLGIQVSDFFVFPDEGPR